MSFRGRNHCIVPRSLHGHLEQDEPTGPMRKSRAVRQRGRTTAELHGEFPGSGPRLGEMIAVMPKAPAGRPVVGHDLIANATRALPGTPRGKEVKIKDLTFWPTGNRCCRAG
jgi:hypothetical protein